MISSHLSEFNVTISLFLPLKSFHIASCSITGILNSICFYFLPYLLFFCPHSELLKMQVSQGGQRTSQSRDFNHKAHTHLVNKTFSSSKKSVPSIHYTAKNCKGQLPHIDF